MGSDAFLPAALVIGYLFGSIPFGVILTRLAGTQDLRSIGSGSIGATNVLRCGHLAGPNAAMLAGRGAFLGHLFPVWLKFRGGKGGAVYIGILLGLFWPGAIFFCLVWLATAVATRYSSLSAFFASVLTPIVLWAFGHVALAALCAVLTLLLFYMHRENIRRLRTGTENRIGAKN